MSKPKKNIKTCSCGKPRMKGRRKCFFCILVDRHLKKLTVLSRKLNSKKYKESELKKWRRKAWTIFSKYMRRRGADFAGYTECFTCLKTFPWQELHLGHFKHGKLDFDEQNCHPQCAQCNTYNGGRLDKYAIRLVEEIGLEAVKDLEKRAAQEIPKTTDQLKAIYILYQDLFNKLLQDFIPVI